MMVATHACPCGARDEFLETDAILELCWSCKNMSMAKYGNRQADYFTGSVGAELSDKRTANGGY